jgi:hypothetical protein
MELHHLHVAQRQARAQRHREAVAALVARGRVELYIVGPPPVASSTARLHEDEFPGAHVDQQHARERAAVASFTSSIGAVLLEAGRRPPPTPARRERLMISMPVRSPLWHGAVEGLAGERLLVQRAVGIAVEEAADLVLRARARAPPPA